MLILAMDANFRLKSRLRSSAKKEPMLGLGMSYFVHNDLYADFIKGYVDKTEVRAAYNSPKQIITIKQTDQQLCRLSGVAQYAHEKVEGFARDRHDCCQLCVASNVSSIGHG